VKKASTGRRWRKQAGYDPGKRLWNGVPVRVAKIRPNWAPILFLIVRSIPGNPVKLSVLMLMKTEVIFTPVCQNTADSHLAKIPPKALKMR